MFLKDNKRRIRKRIRVRKKLSGTSERPRISVYRSAVNMHAQLIDDVKGVTLASASSLSKEILDEIKGSKGKVSKSKLVGKLLAKKALELGISTAVFDRSGYEFHGRVKAVADGAREGGIKV
jgi:large subunit ribosomal protein L18